MEKGSRFPLMDSLLAAQAIGHQLTLVTRNVKDFSETGVVTTNPWD
jgi:predicted nucleic acid-binding protein